MKGKGGTESKRVPPCSHREPRRIRIYVRCSAYQMMGRGKDNTASGAEKVLPARKTNAGQR